MDPMTATVTVDAPREEIYALLEDLRAHEQFTDHFLVDYSGDADHIRARAKMPGPKQWSDVEWVEKEAPARLVEHLTAAGGKRETRGTWTLAEAGDGRTDVSFTFEFLRTPVGDKLLAPLVRSMVGKGNRRSLERLKSLVETR